ncbi:hypothetical protein ACFUNF_37820 [Streptomyces sp. NPDC057291]|uniref:hypothetical protein n=1 Tax=Streptomyces sp. NPDC057291 TaxID=3346087 RepID=UPI00362ED11A
MALRRHEWQPITDALTNTGTKEEYSAREDGRRQKREAARALEQQRREEPAPWEATWECPSCQADVETGTAALDATGPRRAACARTANTPATKSSKHIRQPRKPPSTTASSPGSTPAPLTGRRPTKQRRMARDEYGETVGRGEAAGTPAVWWSAAVLGAVRVADVAWWSIGSCVGQCGWRS